MEQNKTVLPFGVELAQEVPVEVEVNNATSRCIDFDNGGTKTDD